MELRLTRTARRNLTTAAVAILLCGCAPEDGYINENSNTTSAQKQYETLLQRPDLEDMTDQYQQLLKEVKTILTSSYNLAEWEFSDDSPVGAAGCGFDFPKVHLPYAMTRTISGGFTRSAIPDHQWSEATGTVTTIANRYGFKGPERVADKPGQRAYNYYDATGTRFHVGQGDNMTVSISTGCFLTPEAHSRSASQLARDDS